jgi:hypothetical protein
VHDLIPRYLSHKLLHWLAGAHDLLALKGNQPTLETDVEDYFDTAPAAELATKTTVEKGHGRIETPIYAASDKVDWIGSDRSYPGRASL